jgi:hypothetical protein
MADPIAPTDRFRRSDDFVGRKIAGETVLVPLRQQIGDLESIYTLNELGSFIWDRLDGAATVQEIASAIAAEFEATTEEICTDLDAFLGRMREISAIANAAADPTPQPPAR